MEFMFKYEYDFFMSDILNIMNIYLCKKGLYLEYMSIVLIKLNMLSFISKSWFSPVLSGIFQRRIKIKEVRQYYVVNFEKTYNSMIALGVLKVI